MHAKDLVVVNKVLSFINSLHTLKQYNKNIVVGKIYLFRNNGR